MEQVKFLTKKAGNIALEDVFEAYYECRKNKRRTMNAISFELDFEREIVQLWQDINSGSYKIGRSIAFIVKYPVQREVFAANFRDRIVHHLVISKINALFEQEFIVNSYSCRIGKGTLYGVKSVESMIKECSGNYSQDCYVLKLDIRSFFMSMDKTILYKMLSMFIKERYHNQDKDILLQLIKQIVFHKPEKHCIIKGSRSDWNGLPCYKSLFWSDENCGLPIGNLTSQVFANFYLNQLDKFVSEVLKIPYYGRYVDDFVLIHQNKEELLKAKKKIESFLKSRLKLTLHPQKVYLQHYSKGVKFIGAVIKPNRIYIANRTKNNLYRKIYKWLPKMANSLQDTLSGLGGFMSCINSYLGFMKHYSTFKLRHNIISKLDKTFLNNVIELVPRAEKLAINKCFSEIEHQKSQLRRQRQNRKYWKKNTCIKENKNGFVQSITDL